MGANFCEAPLPVRQRRLFLSQFEQDLDFVKLFFLLAKKSRINRHMGILWARDGPAAEMGIADVSTEHALESPCARWVSCDRELDPEFCSLVNGFREHEPESCGISDHAAEKRCRETGCTQIYTCHAGLVDIAVPVISEGRYIATLLCGQVLGAPPTEERFERIRAGLRHLPHIDMERLREAYYKVPVASQEEIRGAAQLMEALAGQMATAWSRVSRLTSEQHRAAREQSLVRYEFAWAVLNGLPADRAELRRMLAHLGFGHPPNRVLLLEPAGGSRGGPAFDLAVTRALREVEEAGAEVPDFVPVYLRKQGICIFLHDPAERAAAELAGRILARMEAAGIGPARMGIGGPREDLCELAESYEEARTALGRTGAAIAVFEPAAEPAEDLSAAADRFSELLAARNLIAARQAAAALPVLALRRLGAQEVDVHRRFFRTVLYGASAAVRRIGMDSQTIRRFLEDADAAIEAPGGLVDVHEAFRNAAAALIERSRELYAGRAHRLVERASRIIGERIESRDTAARVSPGDVAERLGISVSHLSRTFRQITGVTFERAVMERRVALARKLLLDPALNVSQVAVRCGFADAAYFARVFRAVAGCTPSEYMRNPLAHAAPPVRPGTSPPASLASACQAAN